MRNYDMPLIMIKEKTNIANKELVGKVIPRKKNKKRENQQSVE